MSQSSFVLTFELDFGVGIFLRSSRISFLVFVRFVKFFSIFIVALRVSTKYISAVAGMLNSLAEYVRLVIMKDDIVKFSLHACSV